MRYKEKSVFLYKFAFAVVHAQSVEGDIVVIRGTPFFCIVNTLDPHRDPHGETSVWNQWRKECQRPHPFERKWPEVLGNEGIEPSKAVGKDEVGSSNLPSSSKSLES